MYTLYDTNALMSMCVSVYIVMIYIYIYIYNNDYSINLCIVYMISINTYMCLYVSIHYIYRNDIHMQ